MDQFKKLSTFEKRQNESQRIVKKYPERIPVVVCKNYGDNLPDIDKQKYLVPKDMSLGQFIYIIRKRIKLKSEQALFIMVNHSLQPGNKLLDEIYETNKSEDNFLYVVYSSENTFG